MIKLKRCPFCGGEAKLTKIESTGEFCVGCCNGGCGVIPNTWTYKTKTEAVNAWNTRWDSAKMEEEVEYEK